MCILIMIIHDCIYHSQLLITKYICWMYAFCISIKSNKTIYLKIPQGIELVSNLTLKHITLP